MIQGMIAKKVIDIVLKRIMEKREIRNLRKYVEEPNDADDRIDKLEIQVHRLEKFSHEKADFVCTSCGCKAKRVNKKKKRRK